MVTYNARSFGSYVYDPVRDGAGPVTSEIGFRHRQSKSFSRDGAFAVNSLQDPRRFSMEGTLTGAGGLQDAASLRAAWDMFAAAHQAGPALPLCVDSDRYLNAQVETLHDQDDGLSHQYAVGFLCFDPYLYAQVSTVRPLTVGGAVSVTTGGTVYSLPVVTLTFTAAGGTATLASAQDATLTFSPPAAGTFTLDCRAETITDAGGTDWTAQFTGDLIRLVAGQIPGGGTQANALTLTVSGGAALSAATIGYQDRWL